MNYFVRITVCILAALVLSATKLLAQTQVNDQSTELRKMKVGVYQAYYPKDIPAIHVTTGQSIKSFYEIVEKHPEKNQPQEHFELEARIRRDADESSDSYFPDNMAFPVTYVKNSYLGNKELQEKIGYATSRGTRIDEADRLVFLDGVMYELTDWKDKDNYTLWSVSFIEPPKMEEKEGGEKKKGFKGLKAKLKAATQGGPVAKYIKENNLVQKLQDYLDAATAQQEKVYAEWIKKPENARTKQTVDDIYTLMISVIRQKRTDYFNSEEYKRIQRNNEMGGGSSDSEVTIKNTGSRTICISHSGGTQSLTAGSSASFSCSGDISYGVDSGSGCRSGGSLIVGANQGCGKTIEVQ